MKLRTCIGAVLAVGLGVQACGSGPSQRGLPANNLASPDRLPVEVRQAPVTVRQAYQFALANTELLRHIPCYCGCGRMGHTSNAACYLKHDSAPGQTTVENHALGCSICVDITQDVMRMQREGRSLNEMQRYIRDTYSSYGPSNIENGT